MSSTVFKITNPLDGVTRRLAFTSAPAWADLAGKLESIFDIRKDDICVAYIDTDGDEVVLSSDAELKDFYEAHAAEESEVEGSDSVRAIRFSVRSLNAVRQNEDGNAGRNNIATEARAEDVQRDASPIVEEAAVMNNEAQSDNDTSTLSSVDSDVESINSADFPDHPFNNEPLFAFMGGRGGGRGHPGPRGHFRGGRGRPDFGPHHGFPHYHHHGPHGPHHGPTAFPPFPPFMTPAGAPPPAPPPFGMFGGERGGRGGRHAPHEHMRGMRGHPYHPHHHRGHGHHQHPMGSHVPPFPPMRGGFMFMQGVDA